MNSSVEENNSEISLLDTLVFLRRFYKLIPLVGILGVAAAINKAWANGGK
jgi:hypothetical protein